MKKLIPVCLLLLALAVGLLLPRGYMLILDETLADPEAIATGESVLLGNMKLTGRVEKLLESQTVARRLMEFRDGVVVMPTDTLDYEEKVEVVSGEEAVRIAMALLNDLVEEPLNPHETIVMNQRALLSDGVDVRVWQVEIHFNGSWIAKMIIDVGNEAVLQLDIRNGEGMALWRFFRKKGFGADKSEWVEQVSQRIGECLSDYMGTGSLGSVEVIPSRKTAVVTFEGTPPTAVEVPFWMELYRGIYFNVGSKS